MLSRSHARLAPSAAKRWIACPGSPAFIESLDPALLATGESAAASEGTFLHDIAQQYLTGHPEVLGRLNEEQINLLLPYLQYTERLRDAALTFGVEARVALKAAPELYGYVDFWALDEAESTLHVVDLKTGRIAVDALDNWQLIIYALATIDTFNLQPVKATVAIVSPRLRRLDVATYTYEELQDRQAQLLEFIATTRHADAPLVPGDHCTFCPAAAVCPALVEHIQTEAVQVFRAEPTPPAALSIEDIRKLAPLIPVLESWIEDYKKYVEALLKAGEDIPHYKLVERRPRRYWQGDETEIVEAIQRLEPGVDPYDRKLKSPAQIEALLGEKFEYLLDYVVKRSSGVTLAPASDGRPDVTKTDTLLLEGTNDV